MLGSETSHITNLFGFLLKFWTVFDFITDQSTKQQIRKMITTILRASPKDFCVR